MNYYLTCWKKYADFNGRARRSEYWMFVLFNFLVYAVIFLLNQFVSTYAFIGLPVYALATFIPSLAVAVRRLHDQGKGGGWIFISFVPFIGGIWFLVLMFIEGQQGSNSFGPDPKAS